MDPDTVSVDILVSSATDTIEIGVGLDPRISTQWDTIMVADGWYEVQAEFHDASSQLIEEVTYRVLVNNSVYWHGGNLKANETWAADKVHLIENDVLVESGVVLTIEPGAVIKFLFGVSLIVNDGGIVDASASLTLSITFTSLSDDSADGDTNLDDNRSFPNPGDWGGLIT